MIIYTGEPDFNFSITRMSKMYVESQSEIKYSLGARREGVEIYFRNCPTRQRMKKKYASLFLILNNNNKIVQSNFRACGTGLNSKLILVEIR